MQATAIRALRRRNGWTQADLAVRLGTDPVTISRWERGASRPRPSAQARLRELSGFPPDIVATVRVIGDVEAARVLRRALLLTHRSPVRRFAANPTRRLRQVERARREQAELKERVQPGP